MLPRAARERLVARAVAELDDIAPPPEATVPVTHEGWRASLADAGLTGGDCSLIKPLADAARAAGSDTPREIGRAAEGLARAGADFDRSVWMLSALRPASGGEVGALRVVASASVRKALEAIIDREPEEAVRGAANVSAAIEVVQRVRSGMSPDPCEALFGYPRSELCDDRGILSASRILAANHGRYDALMRDVAAVLLPVTAHPPWGIDGLHAVIPLIVTPRPLITLSAATGVRALIEQGMAINPIATATPLRELKLRVDRSAASHAGMIRTSRNLEEATTQSDSAILKLDLYRRMAESQLRPWAWTLLRMTGRTGTSAPELASLREQLIADGSSLLVMAASAILAGPRNAAAHEDFVWNEQDGTLIVGSTEVSISEIDDATAFAYSFMLGAECGWACARAESSTLAALLDAEDPPAGLPAIDIRNASNRFGTNGLRLMSSTYELQTLVVVLEELPFHGINPCFQAILEAARIISHASQFEVHVLGRDAAVIELPRDVVDATNVVWSLALKSLREMPLSTFLPSNAVSRLKVETPARAAAATSWLALNDAVHAYNDAHEASGTREERAAALAARLDVVATALAMTATVLPSEAVKPLERARALVTRGKEWADCLVRGETPDSLRSSAESRLRRLLNSRGSPSVLPTLDPRSMNEVLAEIDP